jgi:arginine decarboxylase
MSTDTKAVSGAAVPSTSTDLADFFSATEARTDRWRQLNAIVRAWQSAAGGDTDATKRYAEAVALFGDVAMLEAFFAYPGPKVMSAIEEALAERNAGVCARLVQVVSGALMTETYRTDPAAWDPLREETTGRHELLPPELQGGTQTPYFEILLVTGADPAGWERARADIKRLRRPDDPFIYEIVQVGTFEDAVIATICNHDLQAIVIRDGFEYRSRHNAPMLRDFLLRHLGDTSVSTDPGALATALGGAVNKYRPELDLFLLSDRSVEELAGSDAAAPFRRIFHNIDEMMELHLAIMDGINDRFETPYFNNLK